MKNTIQILSLAAAAALIAGCSSPSNQYPQTPVPPNGTSVDMSRNTDGTAGNSAYNFNQGSYTPKQEVTLDQLPQPSQTTIRNQIGNVQIENIKQETKDGEVVYRVELQRKNWHSGRPNLVVAADGSLLKESHMKTINESAGAEAAPTPESSALGSTPNNNPSAAPNPAGPTPAFPPASVQNDR